MRYLFLLLIATTLGCAQASEAPPGEDFGWEPPSSNELYGEDQTPTLKEQAPHLFQQPE